MEAKFVVRVEPRHDRHALLYAVPASEQPHFGVLDIDANGPHAEIAMRVKPEHAHMFKLGTEYQIGFVPLNLNGDTQAIRPPELATVPSDSSKTVPPERPTFEELERAYRIDAEGRPRLVQYWENRAPVALKLDSFFTYHAPFGDQAARYTAIREDARTFAESLIAKCPGSQELNDAIDLIRQAVFKANAAIACNERPMK